MHRLLWKARYPFIQQATKQPEALDAIDAGSSGRQNLHTCNDSRTTSDWSASSESSTNGTRSDSSSITESSAENEPGAAPMESSENVVIGASGNLRLECWPDSGVEREEKIQAVCSDLVAGSVGLRSTNKQGHFVPPAEQNTSSCRKDSIDEEAKMKAHKPPGLRRARSVYRRLDLVGGNISHSSSAGAADTSSQQSLRAWQTILGCAMLYFMVYILLISHKRGTCVLDMRALITLPASMVLPRTREINMSKNQVTRTVHFLLCSCLLAMYVRYYIYPQFSVELLIYTNA